MFTSIKNLENSYKRTTGEGDYKGQIISERCTLFFRKFTVVPYKHLFTKKFSESCTL